jgi:hypothetical protein
MLFVCWNDFRNCSGRFETLGSELALLIVRNCKQHPGCLCHYGHYDTSLDAEIVCCERSHSQQPCRAVKYVLREVMVPSQAVSEADVALQA